VNRLGDSTSLYLAQHADNPVHWHPWDEQALALARATGRPILLSIGYSACHWCHVMAHESFENPETAGLMNELFVNIKVDREERPDLDRLYQLAHQLLTGRGGGWPLTVFLHPEDLAPFFAGTYFPPVQRHGMPAFPDLLRRLRQWYDANPAAVAEQNRRLSEALAAIQQAGRQDGKAGEALFANAFRDFEQRYDAEHGGFGGAPKFPQAPQLALLQALSGTGAAYSETAQGMLRLTLARMARSGLRDHLDGGFFRYCVDGTWTIPHFEKMLYDNALLLPLYAETGARSGDALLGEAAEGIAGWLLREMHGDDGGFFASMDADADGVEGGYHVWNRAELETLLDAGEFDAAVAAFGLAGPPNFEGRHWHLVRGARDADGADRELLERARRKMLEARSRRIAPATDTKRLAAWNALAVEGLARAGLALAREDWVDAAARTMSWLRGALWRDGRLHAVFAGGQARFPAYLDDHAFLLRAGISLLQARWSHGLLRFLRELADTLLARFAAPAEGGFYFTADDQHAPVARLRPVQDDATPAGNGVAAQALQALGHLVAEPRYLEAAAHVLAGTRREQSEHPVAHASLVMAALDEQRPPLQVVVTGEDLEEMRAWRALANRRDPVHCYLLTPDGGQPGGIPGLYEATERTTAYVCEGLRCLPPVSAKQELEKLLNALECSN